MRPDLLSLGEESLAALTNRGIVKRSVRDVAEGKGPTVTEAENGSVAGTFTDGVTAAVDVGMTLADARCSCPASGICRHLVMLVLAYRSVASEPVAWEDWSPAEFDDEAIERQFGTRAAGIARKILRAGYRARVRRATAADPVPTVELPSCTVRFLAPHELGYARVDAAEGTRTDAVFLAVWAFRAADTNGSQPVVYLAVGGEKVVSGVAVQAAFPLLHQMVSDGISQLGPAVATSIAAVRQALDSRNLRWPVDAIDELADQIDAYRSRSANYHEPRPAALIAELVARHRCVTQGGAALHPDVLGTDEPATTPLRLLRMTGLGARITGDGTSRRVEVYLAHSEAGIVLTVAHTVTFTEGETVSGPELGGRRAGGAKLSTLAAGNVVTESAHRSANRLVRIAPSRVAKTMVAPSAGAWESLASNILVQDLDAEGRRLAGLAPAVIRPRVVADSLRAIAVESIEDISYSPGSQELRATIMAPTGRAVVMLSHSAAAPGAVDAAAAALGSSDIRFVAGHLSRHGGLLVLEPTAIVAGDTVVVPAFAAATDSRIGAGLRAPADPLAAAIDEALAVSSEVVHRGWLHLTPAWSGRAARAAETLRKLGLTETATSLSELALATKNRATSDLLERWADTHIRLLLTAEQL